MSGFLYLAVAAFGLFMLWRLSRGAMYVPIDGIALTKVLDFARVRHGEKAADLGAGDGRIVIALAKAGAQAHGFEHNPILVWIGRYRIRAAGLKGRAFMHHGNFWNIDLAPFDIVTVFGVGYIMAKLERKVIAEARPGARIVSRIFTFPSLVSEKASDGVHLYIKE
jgi:ribosomal protein L11 methylase PrmA